MPADEHNTAEPEERRARLLTEFMERITPRRPEGPSPLDAAASDLFRAFERGGVDALLLKGPALERALYAAGERRAYVDIDVLVAPAHRVTARDTLLALGYIDAHAPLGIDDIGGVVHAESWLASPESDHPGVLVELHLWLAGAKAPPETAWEALRGCRGSVELEGTAIPTLGHPGLAMGLAIHAAQHGPHYIKGLAELRLGLERWPAEVWRDAADLAKEVDAGAALAAGLRLIPEGAALAQELGLPAPGAIDWEIRNPGARPRGTFHLGAFLEAGSVGARMGVLRRALLPTPEWIASEHTWARPGGLRLVAAYLVHLIQAPLWIVRAWRFRSRAPR